MEGWSCGKVVCWSLLGVVRDFDEGVMGWVRGWDGKGLS